MTSFDTLMNTRTLAARLAEGRIPVTDALRYAMQLAEALRKMHDEGRVHGSIAPASVALENHSVELLPAMVSTEPVTPYTAPEVIAGRAPDARSDIFSFGTVVYEMLTGRRAFEGEDRGKPASSGSPAVDRFLGGCLAVEPEARLQSIKRAMMELKLLHAAARRAEAPPESRLAAAEAGLRAEAQQLETRVTSRLHEQQKFVAEVQQAVTEAVASLRGQLSAVSAELASTRELSSTVEQTIEAASTRIISHVQQSVDAVSERIAALQVRVDASGVRIAALEEEMLTANSRIHRVEEKPPAVEIPATVQDFMDTASQRISDLEQALALANEEIERLSSKPEPKLVDPEEFLAVSDRVSHLEEGLDAVSDRGREFREMVTQQLQQVEKQLQSQSGAVESARTAIAQTDDLVERVVEALESLQTIVLEQSGEKAVD